MAPAPVLKKVYGRVDILDLDFESSSFSLASSVYFLGDSSKHVKTIDDFTTKNKPLVAALGVDTIKALSSKGLVSGGADDGNEWDDFEDLDDLLDTEMPLPINAKPQDTSSSSRFRGNYFVNYTFYSRDKPSDIRDKIAVVTDIKPYKQYLWSTEARKSLDGDELSIFHHWSTAVRRLEGYAVDGRLYVKQPELSVDEFEKDSTIVITCISLDSIIHRKDKLQFLSRSDIDSYMLIYNNAIRPYYSQVPLAIFNQYLSDETALETSYPALAFSKHELAREYAKRDKLIAELNKEKQVVIDSDNSNKLLTTTTTSLVLSLNHGDSQPRIDTVRLFQHLDMASYENIASIDIYTIDDESRGVRLRKLQQRDQFRVSRDECGGSFQCRSYRRMMYDRTLVISFLPSRNHATLSMSIDRYGSVLIKASPSQTQIFSKNAFMQILIGIINPVIQKINTFTTIFIIQSRLELIANTVASLYRIVSSSTTLTFRFSVGYSKLLDTIIDKLLDSGFLRTSTNDTRRNKGVTSFEIDYGVVRSETLRSRSTIDVKNLSGVAVVILSNLDVEETNLYIDVLGRMVTSQRSTIEVKALDKFHLGAVDPVLFRPRLTADSYSRICQRKFQPVITKENDPQAKEYFNFTFKRPEYYKCPTKDAPFLGFIEGRHSKGYCLPCCRKTEQSNSKQLQGTCTADKQDFVENSRSSSYKIDYPHADVSNSKILNRRIAIPEYVSQLFGLSDVIANGAVLAVVGVVRDDLNSDYQSYLQTASLLAAVEPSFPSVREFILAVIAMIKQPLSQIEIMKHPIVSSRFTSPQALIHAIEDQCLKSTVLVSNRLSAVEWNDLMVSFANTLGMNVLIIADERLPNKGIQVTNLHEINNSKPVSIFLKRVSTEWSIANHNTRAMYLPLTGSQYRITKRSQLSIPRFNISNGLRKLLHVSLGTSIKLLSKQLTMSRLRAMADFYKPYYVRDDLLDQKLALVDLATSSQMITTICTVSVILKPSTITQEPTATLVEVLAFIEDYNKFLVRETKDMDTLRKSYELYLQAALKLGQSYEYVALKAYILKVSKFAVVDENVIGVVVNVVDVKSVIATELIFFKQFPVNELTTHLARSRDELSSMHSRLDAIAILCYPMIPMLPRTPEEQTKIKWLNHPLRLVPPSTNATCSQSLIRNYSTGVYRNGIYRLLSKDIVEAWDSERPVDLIEAILSEVKKMGSLPYAQTKIDSLITSLSDQFANYDPTILRVAITNVFEIVNSVENTPAKAKERIRSSQEFNGFDIKNVHRLTHEQLTAKIKSLFRELTQITRTYPTFEVEKPIADQDQTFYDSKSGKLLIHEEMTDDLVSMLISDFLNPFRRDYILHQPFMEGTFADIRPHIGEIIYVQRIRQ